MAQFQNFYPFGVASTQEDIGTNKKFASNDATELFCHNFSIIAVPQCSAESDVMVEVPEIHFELQFNRTEYEYEEEVITNGDLQVIPIHNITRYRHNFTTVMMDEEFKRINQLKHYGFKLISNLDLAQSFPIERLEVQVNGEKDANEYQVEISFLIVGEETITEACCDSPVSTNFQLTNCGDELYQAPPNRCADTTLVTTQIDNGDGTVTLNAAATGYGAKFDIYWFQNGEMVGSGSSLITSETGTFCARVVGDNCTDESCITIVDECIGEVSISSAGCNTVVSVVNASDVDAHSGTITDSDDVVVETFGGTGDTSYSFTLPYGDYILSFTPKAGCPAQFTPFTVTECESECGTEYDAFTFSCSHSESGFTPSADANGQILSDNLIEFSLNGGQSWGVYVGGAVAGDFAMFRWTVKIDGCEQRVLYTGCVKPCCPDIELPSGPISVTVDNVVQVDGDFCCDETSGGGGTDGNGNPCPDPLTIAGSSNVIPRRNDAFGVFGTYFAPENADEIHFQTDGTTYVLGGGGTTINLEDCVWGAAFPDSGDCSRINKSGIWTDDPTATDVTFALCFNVDVGGIYSFGFGADNAGIVKVDGVQIFNLENNGGTSIQQQYTFKRWFIVEKHLSAGQHIIEVNAVNADPATPSTVGFEIYNATAAQLQQLTTEAEIDAMVHAHSRQIDNLNLVFNVAGGLECPSGTTAGYNGCVPVCICDENYIPTDLNLNVVQEGNLLMATSNCTGVESFEWFGDLGDGNGFVSVGSGANYSANQSGVYYVVVTCDAETLQSAQYVVGGGAWLL